MSDERVSISLTTRRYSRGQKDQAVRLVQQVREETGEHHGAVVKVARQLGFGVESLRKWVVQSAATLASGRGPRPRSTPRFAGWNKRSRVAPTEAILKSASAFFAAELDRPPNWRLDVGVL
jgi:transposase-like protein